MVRKITNDSIEIVLEFTEGQEVWHKVDGNKGIVSGYRYYSIWEDVEYCIAFGSLAVDENWCNSIELSDVQVF